ncbi:hypothetical protein CYMTET_51749 [Cymbomonas tetramitiformis]|uniref:WRKY19-like zinc finger domain-containing protein n=1 Tax=Cymbomonas tetramitiformis TaxID=36881 RepID=A0AAE0ES10_9CHLO|nr:hypothetical protein CYMTET_51749 [Cymbomonas tetramitiformis]
MTLLDAVEVPRTEEIEQRADLEHGPDKLRGRQILSFFADHVCYTDGDKEELTWRQLCPKLLPFAPVSEEKAGFGEWAHAVTVAAQAPASSPLEGDREPQAAGGSVNNAGARIVGPPADGCTKSARGSTGRCIAHGGGKRCQADGCTKSAVGSTEYCIAHGGGKRCQADGCTTSAEGRTEYCTAHRRRQALPKLTAAPHQP